MSNISDAEYVEVKKPEADREFPWGTALLVGGVALTAGVLIGRSSGYHKGYTAGSYEVMKDAVKANAALHKAAMSAASTHLPG